MSLTLYYHPLASYCWKVLVALYESDTPFTPHLVDLADPKARADLARLWPVCKFPVLRDHGRDQTIPESSIIIEYLAQHYPSKLPLIDADPDLARETRLRDRFYDLYVHEPMQKIVGDRLRASERHDPHGVEQAKSLLETAYGMVEQQMATNRWAIGASFSMADCAAAPALFYANRVLPIGASHAQTSAYLKRLEERPSFARVIDEAGPYFKLFPSDPGVSALVPESHAR
jgi:glutathione S-transferase